MNYCVVGDVHGEYKALLNLVAKTPVNSQLIFVGDLIDRGTQSAEVVRFVRKHNLLCVRGNHEEMMIQYGAKFISDIENNNPIEQDNMWLKHGGRETLLSYGLISVLNDQLSVHPFVKDFIFQFQDDINWMKKLPVYLELDEKHESGRTVVISHSAIAPVWAEREKLATKKHFEDTVLWGRMKPLDNAPIFNIFGHTPQQYNVDMQEHYINVDTGCYKKRETGFGLLSAYCLETGEVYASSDLTYERVS
jgi:serine/threonine protein phosphatase 1